MRDLTRRLALAASTTALFGMGLSGVADAATTKHHRRHSTRHASNTSTTSSSDSTSGSSTSGGPAAETALTGTTKTQAEAAALTATGGGTVTRSSIEDPSDPSGAAYEVHVTKSDGSHVVVLENSSFGVLSTTAEQGGGGCG
jgi:hypothetical protein